MIPVVYKVTPAGAQSRLGDLPLTAKLFPDGKALLVVNAGQGMQAMQVIAADTGDVLQSIQYKSPEAVFLGTAFSPDACLRQRRGQRQAPYL